jgi:carboxylesterase type B
MLPLKPLNFRAAIMESEALDHEDSSSNLATLAKALGCQPSEDQLAYIRAAKMEDIVYVIDAQCLVFSPIHDNITITDNFNAIMESSSLTRLPIIIGTNSNEGSTFIALDKLEKGILPVPYTTLAKGATLSDFQCPDSNITKLLVAKGLFVHRYFFNATFLTTFHS